MTGGEWFTVYADDGEYGEQADSIEQALAQFRARQPDCFVAAVVNDGMRPRLVLEEEEHGTSVSPADISYDEDSRWCQEHGHTGLLAGCETCDRLVRADPRFAAYAEIREQDHRDHPHDEPCPNCGRRQWTDEHAQETCQACGFVWTEE